MVIMIFVLKQRPLNLLYLALMCIIVTGAVFIYMYYGWLHLPRSVLEKPMGDIWALRLFFGLFLSSITAMLVVTVLWLMGVMSN